jgi:3-deoxy-7-phosphoheptulonate synthase
MFRTPQIDDLNVVSQVRLVSPETLHDELPLSEAARRTVLAGRDTLKRILERADPRRFVVVGPCSIHDPAAALDYGRRLAALAREVEDTFFLVMRVYFEKPRTTVGWKGLINDPDLDDSFHIEKGLRIARKLLLDLNELGLPCGTEALDPITPQYIADLISWSAIGARTTESQTHRIDPEGRCALTYTRGNRHAHIVLRGGAAPNYDTVSVALTEQELDRAGLPRAIMIDCSHGNSGKDPARQPLVFADVIHQIIEGNRSIVGGMIESNLEWGSQPLAERSRLRYGVSITDACIDWPTTEKSLREARAKLKARHGS